VCFAISCNGVEVFLPSGPNGRKRKTTASHLPWREKDHDKNWLKNTVADSGKTGYWTVDEATSQEAAHGPESKNSRTWIQQPV
jgi:hypothetical protein